MRRVNSKISVLLIFFLWLPTAKADQIGDWSLSCKQTRCEITQSVLTAQNATKLKVTILQNQKGLFALVVAPLGIALSNGLNLRVDGGKVIRYAFATCTVAGCFSAVPLNGNTLSAWKRGIELSFSYQDGAGENVSGTFSLKGVTAGITKIIN